MLAKNGEIWDSFGKRNERKGVIFMATFLVFLLCIGGTFCICKLIILITYRKLCELALWLLDLGLFNDLFSDRLTGRDTVKSEVIEKKISDVRFIIGFMVGSVTGALSGSLIVFELPYRTCAICCAILVVLMSYFGMMRTIRMQVGYWDPDYDGRVAIRDAHHHELCDFKLNKDCNFYNNSRFPEPGERCMMVKIRDYVEWISLS